MVHGARNPKDSSVQDIPARITSGKIVGYFDESETRSASQYKKIYTRALTDGGGSLTFSCIDDGCLPDQALITILPEPLQHSLRLFRIPQNLKSLDPSLIFVDLDESLTLRVRSDI